jgi:general stress protein 26
MATAKRVSPDFLFLANKNSQKFKDLKHSKDCQITFRNSSSEDWVSISGTATTASNSDPRIKELYNKGLRAWFGDLGDGKHDGGPEDPRLALIEVKSRYVAYWKATVGILGFVKEVGVAAVTRQVANTTVQRQLLEFDLEQARRKSEEL